MTTTPTHIVEREPQSLSHQQRERQRPSERNNSHPILTQSRSRIAFREQACLTLTHTHTHARAHTHIILRLRPIPIHTQKHWSRLCVCVSVCVCVCHERVLRCRSSLRTGRPHRSLAGMRETHRHSRAGGGRSVRVGEGSRCPLTHSTLSHCNHSLYLCDALTVYRWVCC